MHKGSGKSKLNASFIEDEGWICLKVTVRCPYELHYNQPDTGGLITAGITCSKMRRQPLQPVLLIRMVLLLWHPCLSQCAGEDAGQGHHICTKGHQEEARRGQQAGRTHPLGEEDSLGGSLAFRCEVSPAQTLNAFQSSAPSAWENIASLICFWWNHSRGPEQIMSCQWGGMAGDIEIITIKMQLFFYDVLQN